MSIHRRGKGRNFDSVRSRSKEALKIDAFETPAKVCVHVAFERRAAVVGRRRPRRRPATTQNQKPTQSAFRLVDHQRPASAPK